MMTKIVLFFPNLESGAIRLLPASLLHIAAPLVKENYEVRIIDQRLEKDWRGTLLKELKDNPLVVGISALTGKQILHGLEVSKFVKGNCDARVVWGGVHASLLPEQTLKNPYIDFVVIGEGEYAFLNLIKALESHQSYENLPGVGYKKAGRIFYNPQRDFINLDDLPDLPYHLIDIENYVAKISFASGQPGRNLAFYTSRGCPHRCGFCYNKEFNRRRWRGESAERVIERMKKLIADYGITAFEIEDDEFFANPERAQKIAELIIKENLGIEIFTTCRVNYVVRFMDNEYLQLLRRAGFRTLAFGVETGSPRLQELTHKEITNDQVFETIKKLKKADIGSKYYFMVGFPTETLEEMYATTDLIYRMKSLDHNIRISPWRVYTPYPGTDLYELSVRQGWQPPQSLGEWADYSFDAIRMPWLNAELKSIIENVVFLNKYIVLKDKGIARFYAFLLKFYSRWADFRWRNHLFSFLFEKYAVEFVQRIKNKLYP